MWWLLGLILLQISSVFGATPARSAKGVYPESPNKLSTCKRVGKPRQIDQLIGGRPFKFLEMSCLDDSNKITEWRPVCAQDWLPKNDIVFCRQARPGCIYRGCEKLTQNLVPTHKPEHFFRGRLFCNGNEERLDQCSFDHKLSFPKCANCQGLQIICSCETVRTIEPTMSPTSSPTTKPTKKPSVQPTPSPTSQPSTGPTTSPSARPTVSPTKAPVEICKSIKVLNFPVSSWNGYYLQKNKDVWEGHGKVTANLVFDHAKYEWKLVGKGQFSETVLIPGLREKNLLTLNQEARVENIMYKGRKYTVIFRCKKTPGPTTSPTSKPTKQPTKTPTKKPTKSPTTKNPTKAPTKSPVTDSPTTSPSKSPTTKPTKQPTKTPTPQPTKLPTQSPTYICKAVCVTRGPVQLNGHYVGSNKSGNLIYIEQDGKRLLYYKESKKEWFIRYETTPVMKEVELKDLASKRLGVDRKRLGLENIIFNGQPAKLRLDCCETKEPTATPTKKPSKRPSMSPTKMPTKKPTKKPTKEPTRKPTSSPTKKPTKQPTKPPTKRPTSSPTSQPTKKPTKSPTEPDCPAIYIDSDDCPQLDGAYDRTKLKGADVYTSDKKDKLVYDPVAKEWYIQLAKGGSGSGSRIKLTGLAKAHLDINANRKKHIVMKSKQCGNINITCKQTRSPTMSPVTPSPTKMPTKMPTSSPTPKCDCDESDIIFVLDYLSSTFVWRQQVEIVLKIIGEVLRPGFRFAIVVYDFRARVLANFGSNCYRVTPNGSNLHLILEKLTNMLLDTPPDIRSMLKVSKYGRSFIDVGVKMAMDLFVAQGSVDRQKALFLFTGDYPGFYNSPCGYAQLFRKFNIQSFMYALGEKKLHLNQNFNCLVGGGRPLAFGPSKCPKYMYTYEMSLYYQNVMWSWVFKEYCDCPDKCASDFGSWSPCENQTGLKSRSRQCPGKLQKQVATCLRVPDIWIDICPAKCGRVQDYCNGCFFNCASPTSWSGGYSADICGAVEQRTCISKPCFKWANLLRSTTDGDGRRGVCKAVVKVSSGSGPGVMGMEMMAIGGVVTLIGGVYVLRRRRNAAAELKYVQIPDLDENLA